MSVSMTKAISPVLRDNLLRTARAFAAARQSTLRTVSRQAHGDPPFFDKLEAGDCSFTVRKYDEMMAYFDEHWPEGVLRPVPVNPIHGPSPKPQKRKKPA